MAGYRLQNSGKAYYLHSWNNKDFNESYPGIVKALAHMPVRTVADNWAIGPPDCS